MGRERMQRPVVSFRAEFPTQVATCRGIFHIAAQKIWISSGKSNRRCLYLLQNL